VSPQISFIIFDCLLTQICCHLFTGNDVIKHLWCTWNLSVKRITRTKPQRTQCCYFEADADRWKWSANDFISVIGYYLWPYYNGWPDNDRLMPRWQPPEVSICCILYISIYYMWRINYSLVCLLGVIQIVTILMHCHMTCVTGKCKIFVVNLLLLKFSNR